MNSLVRRLALGLCAAAALPALARAQQTGTITGRVVSRDARQPLSDVNVYVVGTQHGSRTGTDGTYRIVGVTAGAVQLRAQRIGYAAATQAVTVPADGSATADFELATTAVQLDVVVTTAAGTQQSTRQSGASIATIALDTTPPPPAMNFSQLATGKASGVVITQSSGTSGTGARIRIRGANSLSLSNEPLLIIDGVRADNDAESNSVWIGGQTPSRINDLDPDQIESVEVIKGPAAAALYGTAAANGVIQITTKRGHAGAPRWTAFAEHGSIREDNAWPPNYGSWAPGWGPYCVLEFQGLGYCSADSVSAFNPLEQYSPFRTGAHAKYGASVAGGTEALRYFLAADREAEAGIYQTNNVNRTNIRANLSATINPQLDVTVTGGYLRSGLQLTQNDDNYAGVISNGLAGNQMDDPDHHGYYPFGPEWIYKFQDFQDLDRFTGSTTANFRALSWLRFNATVGMDLGYRFDNETVPANVVDFPGYRTGDRISNRIRLANYTSNVAGTATFAPLPAIQSTTTAGVQYQSDMTQGTYGYGEGLVAGTSSLIGVTANLSESEGTVANKTFGLFVSQQLGWRDRLYLTGALRGDKNSAFGPNLNFVLYPSVSASYVISEEPFFPQSSLVSSLRLRAAYGQSGLRPGPTDAQLYYVARAVARASGAQVVDEPGISIGGVGNRDLRPEQIGEGEMGFDLGLFSDRTSLEVTYYNKISHDALVLAPIAPSTGSVASRYENIGSVQNKGLEVGLRASILKRELLSWNANVTASWNRNRVTSLGGDHAPIVFGYATTQRHQEGYAPGAYFGHVITAIDDADGNGIITDNEVTYSDSALYLGSALPTRQASLNTDLTVARYVRLSALLDYRGGNKQLNYSEYFRCLIYTCAGSNLASASEYDRAAASVALQPGQPGTDAAGFYIQPGDFLKLREVALTLSAPSWLASKVRTNALSLTIAGRNLGMWSRYGGIDPEVNVDGQANFTQADFLSQPQVRYYTARVNVTF